MRLMILILCVVSGFLFYQLRTVKNDLTMVKKDRQTAQQTEHKVKPAVVIDESYFENSYKFRWWMDNIVADKLADKLANIEKNN